MIKEIIKRDGSIELFDANKINGWGEWASSTLGDKVDWSGVVLETVAVLGERCTSEALQRQLIRQCLDRKTYEYNRMAGRLYYAIMKKEIYGDTIPTVQQLHKRMVEDGLMIDLGYTDAEYQQVEKIIDHSLNLGYTHYQLFHLRNKYALCNKFDKIEYETPQFIYMRMAMALSVNSKDKLHDVERFYYFFSRNIINAPTPNYVNLGTSLKGYSSCCVYDADDNASSLATGDHIAYMMTVNSAGIGSHIHTRSIGDKVRNGVIEHQGKLPYYRALVGAIKANLQNGRGGAATQYYSCYDPEVMDIQALDNPMTPYDKQIRGLDYAMNYNNFFARAVQENKDIALFNVHDAPDLYWAQFSADDATFERLYNEFVQSGKAKRFMNARTIAIGALTQAYETGRHYLCNVSEMNKHTPFKGRITGSNLCCEIALETTSYDKIQDLYSTDESIKGEIALCSLAGLLPSNIKDDNEYSEAAYYALKMIDVCLHLSEFPFPHLYTTALARMSAGVGIIGLAHYMAKNKVNYATQKGRDFAHELFETHYYHLLRASLKLSKELGVAKWMHKTKWVDGWLPIDTYNKNADDLVTVPLKRDWETLRKEIIDNGGIRNTVLVAHMPSESSSVSSGTTNGLYPIRSLSLSKTNASMKFDWVAPDSTDLQYYYDIAWDIAPLDMIKFYAVVQKWTDQAISADLWDNLTNKADLSATELLKQFLYGVKYGVKTRYYTNVKTSAEIDLEASDAVGCSGGACTL